MFPPIYLFFTLPTGPSAKSNLFCTGRFPLLDKIVHKNEPKVTKKVNNVKEKSGILYSSKTLVENARQKSSSKTLVKNARRKRSSKTLVKNAR